MPTIDVAGYPLFYARHRADRNKRPVVILIHGAGSSHLDWPAELRRLPRTTILVPDLPGHGRSGHASLSSVEAYARVMEEWIQALSQDSVVLLGHSMGGAIVLTLALRHVAPIRGIVLLASGARLRVADAILQGLKDDFETTVDWLVTAYWGPDAPADSLALSRRRLMAAGPDVLYADFRAADAFDVMNRLPDIRMPALVMAGREDNLTPPKYAQFMAEHIPDAELLLVPDAHHMLHLQQPALVARAVERFLNRVG